MNATARTRPYRMTARADAAQATAERILDAAGEVFWEHPGAKVSLDEIARRAGVTKQTVLRRFGSRAELFAAAVEREFERIQEEREDVVPGDTAGAVRALACHYERVGDAVLRLLAEEPRNPGLGVLAERGRTYHARWCERAFAPALAGLRGTARERRLAQLVAVTDVHVWQLLRRQRGLGAGQTETALAELIDPLAGSRA